MSMKKDRCKNGHPINPNKQVLLGHIVGVCNNCKSRYLYSSIPATYARDEHNSLGERFHVYVYNSFLVCNGCHNTMINIKIACKPIEEHEAIWINELKDYLGIKQEENKDETPVEDIRSTPD